MSSRYLNIDEILAEDERVPCIFHVQAHRLGHLDPTSGTETVAEGQQLELPLWMAERLREARYISVSLPRNFSAKVRESLLAAPESVRLRERSPHFYEVGLRLAALADTDEAKTLPASIQATLATRVSMILTRALHSEGVDTSRFTEGLTDLEQSLFWAGYRHAKDVREWRLGHTSLMKASVESGSSSSSGAAAGGAGAAGGLEGPPDKRSILGGAYKRRRNAISSDP